MLQTERIAWAKAQRTEKNNYGKLCLRTNLSCTCVSLEGGSGEKMSGPPLDSHPRLKIEELTLPKVSLKLLPGFGVQLKLHTKVRLHGSG